jgi:hypothetical protein
MWHKKTDTTALLDSGATHNFIDPRTITSLGLGTCSLPRPLQVNNVDGTTNREGNITKFCNLWIRQGGKVVKLGFYIANLGSDRIILGHPWFKSFNPSIDWSTNCLEGDDVIIETAGFCSKTKTLNPVARTLQPSDQMQTQQLIPPQYHKHWRVFSEEAALRFPPSHIDNHAIELNQGHLPNWTAKSTDRPKQSSSPSKSTSTRTLQKGTSRKLIPLMPPLCFSEQRVTGSCDPSWIIERSMHVDCPGCLSSTPYGEYHRTATRKDHIY